MATTNTTTLTTAIATKLQRELIPIMQRNEVFGRFSKKGKMKKEGNILKMNRTLQLARQTTFNLSEGATTNTDKSLSTNAIIQTVGIVGDTLAWTDLSMLVSIVEEGELHKAVADQIVATKAYLVAEELATHSLPHRVDNDSTYEVNGTVDSGSTTTMVDDALTQTDNFWGTDTTHPGVVAFVAPTGTNYDIAVPVTDFVASTDTCTLETLQQTVDTSSKYHMAIPTGIAATDKLTLTALTRVAAIHQRMKTPKFNGGIFYGIIDTEQNQDLYGDTTYQAIMQYSKPSLIGNYKVQPVLDTHLIVADDCMYRMDVDGAANATGVVHNALIFGKDAFKVTKWQGGKDDWGVKIHVFGIDDPDSGNKFGMKGWISWNAKAAVGVLRATSIVNLWTGATVLPVVF